MEEDSNLPSSKPPKLLDLKEFYVCQDKISGKKVNF